MLIKRNGAVKKIFWKKIEKNFLSGEPLEKEVVYWDKSACKTMT
jgi:hypothetical protein